MTHMRQYIALLGSSQASETFGDDQDGKRGRNVHSISQFLQPKPEKKGSGPVAATFNACLGQAVARSRSARHIGDQN